jgi:hypothetical protein
VAQRIYDGGRVDAGQVQTRSVGPAQSHALYVGIGADGPRLLEALLFLLRLAHGWTEAEAAAHRPGDR